LFRYAPPSPLRGLGPAGDDPLRNPRGLIANRRPRFKPAQRQPVARADLHDPIETGNNSSRRDPSITSEYRGGIMESRST
ncbi:hypothetical protein, partial [Acidithiobacillus ferriphilus]